MDGWLMRPAGHRFGDAEPCRCSGCERAQSSVHPESAVDTPRRLVPMKPPSRVALADNWFSRILRRLVIDTALFAIATELSVFIRFDMRFVPEHFYLPGWAGIAELALFVAIEIALRVPLATWHFVGLYDVTRILSATILTKTVGLLLISFLRRGQSFSRGAYLISAVLAFLFLVGVRVLARVFYEWHNKRHPGENGRGAAAVPRVIIVGAGIMGEKLLREYESRSSLGRVVGLLDDDQRKLNDTIRGRRVLGVIADAPDIVRRHRVDELIIAIPSAKAEITRRVLTLTADQPVTVKTLPALWELAEGSVLVEQLRQVRLEDLLQRPPWVLDPSPVAAYLHDKVVLVTGAGGSIGAEIVRQVTRFEPRTLVMLGRGENRIFNIERELVDRQGFGQAVAVIGDIRNTTRMQWLFDTWRPDIVFHAAAHKHVPLMEHNPEEAILNNVAGTRILLEQAVLHGTERFVNISTDKAVDPISFMGASKRVAELLVQDCNAKGNMQCSSVRFGNVLGSNGSVIEVFERQLRETRTLQITDPDMERFFMLIPEAVQLVLHAGTMARGSGIFVLKMGDPVRIMDLARSYIKLSGLELGRDASIVITGNRGNEKLTEQLWSEDSVVEETDNQGIMSVITPVCTSGAQLMDLVDRLCSAAEHSDVESMRSLLHEIDPSITIPLGSAGN
jgi:FlaA1/EpsC-like NDP-sugar epimerase